MSIIILMSFPTYKFDITYVEWLSWPNIFISTYHTFARFLEICTYKTSMLQFGDKACWYPMANELNGAINTTFSKGSVIAVWCYYLFTGGPSPISYYPVVARYDTRGKTAVRCWIDGLIAGNTKHKIYINLLGRCSNFFLLCLRYYITLMWLDGFIEVD